MEFPLSISDIGLWVAVMALILIVTSEFLVQHSDYFGDFAIDTKRLRLAALFLGASFMVTVLLRAFSPV